MCVGVCIVIFEERISWCFNVSKWIVAIICVYTSNTIDIIAFFSELLCNYIVFDALIYCSRFKKRAKRTLLPAHYSCCYHSIYKTNCQLILTYFKWFGHCSDGVQLEWHLHRLWKEYGKYVTNEGGQQGRVYQHCELFIGR